MSDKVDAACSSCQEECAIPDLHELCRAHGIDPAVISDGPGLETILERIIEVKSRQRRDAVLEELEAEIEAKERHQIENMQELMQTLGMLSHKINNPLTSLLGRAQLLRVSRDTDPKTRKAAEVIEESAKRIADYVRDLAHIVSESRERVVSRLREMKGDGKD